MAAPKGSRAGGAVDRVLIALLGERVGVLWDHTADETAERARARERIKAVQNLKARRKRQKLGTLGGRRVS
jgi:hypothetical protein